MDTIEQPDAPGFDCCYCGKKIATEQDVITVCDHSPGGWHHDEPVLPPDPRTLSGRPLDPWD